jgi:imidazolonepropionase-like amidohydrolase
MLDHAVCGGLLARWLIALAVCLIPAVETKGQTPPAQITIPKAALLIDGTGAPTLQPAMIRVEGERIVEVGSNLRVPTGARVIELGDATLLPGLVDLHTHPTGDERVHWEDALTKSTPPRAATRVPPDPMWTWN